MRHEPLPTKLDEAAVRDRSVGKRGQFPPRSVPMHSTLPDCRGMTFKEKDELGHRSFVRRLREGHVRITMMPHSHTGYERMRVRMDVEETALSWTRTASDTASDDDTMVLDSVVSIVPWKRMHSSRMPTKAELRMGHHGVYHGVSVAYNNADARHVILLCHGEGEQAQLVAAVRSLVHAALMRGVVGPGSVLSGPRREEADAPHETKDVPRTKTASATERVRRTIETMGHRLATYAKSSLTSLRRNGTAM
ncbi:hypothetical protein H310_08354 [Aphanomyces invadans]|uniref:Uncharacterized protein n=1 Tax=Aphanomyces invadans TaxID=157072 RepID=A0A024TXW6_9STRA|nr:hypothetical protein H310_08354 [Aphanomyces invadans]ETV98853.1 hypothetical protein H310_08354 [Aphanomyces invadans]|eukprot:XP_008872281.1 hypothetical protein H310_08354 [Aphanomyces invadans]